ncbi:MAG: hypothetical protein KF795_28405 [Labilithrix sp.]|nr:hypothetical protein [Labilithrix sp.]
MIARVLPLGLLLVAGCTGSFSATRTSSAQQQATHEVSGRVASYTTAPRGELDGVVLDDGTSIHFPPHAGSAVLPLVQRGQIVRVVGVDTYGPEGKRIEALTITGGGGRTVDVVAISPPPSPAPSSGAAAPPARATPPLPPPPSLTSAEVATTEGRIDGYTTTPSGDMDGLLLSNGLQIHFPAHTGSTLLPLVGRGTTVRVTGSETRGPNGTVIEASKVISISNGRTVDVGSIPAPSTRPPGAVEPPRERAPAPGAAPPPTRVR